MTNTPAGLPVAATAGDAPVVETTLVAKPENALAEATLPIAAAEHEVAAPQERCLDCEAVLTGEYCANCGQHSKHHVHSTPALIGEFVEDLFHADHRVWRTLKPLLLQPGFLTKEYLLGRRTRYTPPFRLYIVLSLIFFLTASLSGAGLSGEGLSIVDKSGDSYSIGPAVQQTQSSYPLDPEATEQLAEFLTRIDKEKREETRERLEAALKQIPSDQQAAVINGMSNPCSPSALGGALPQSLGNRGQLLDICRNVMTNDGEEFARALSEHVPQVMFFFLPLIALFAKVLYLGSKRYYAEHLLFFVHFHAFVFLVLAVNNVLDRALVWLGSGWPETVSSLLTAAVVICTPIYLYRAMRNVYGQGRFVTLTKFSLLLVGYALNMAIAFGIVAAYTAVTLPSH